MDELVAAGNAPFPTLYHWDLPQALQDKGGWQSRETVKAFGDYAGYVAGKLSDRVRHFFTINEFFSFVEFGHHGAEVSVGGGTVALEMAPGLKLAPGELAQVRHHISFSKSHPKMTARWHTLDPVALYWAPKFVQSLWGAKEIHITENGCATEDEPAADGKFYDTDRIMFLRAYLTQLQRATAEGVPVKGHFQWSTMDNFEWNAGSAGIASGW